MADPLLLLAWTEQEPERPGPDRTSQLMLTTVMLRWDRRIATHLYLVRLFFGGLLRLLRRTRDAAFESTLGEHVVLEHLFVGAKALCSRQ